MSLYDQHETDQREGLYDDEPAFTALAARMFPGGAS